jgi:hypothetical protein
MRTFAGRSVLLIPGAVTLALVMSASPALAIAWVKTTLANTTGLALQDAAFNGHDEAVVWQVPGPVTRIRTSTDNGSTFGTTRRIGLGHATRQASTAICGTDVYVAYAQDWSQPSTPNLWLIDVDVRSLSGASRIFSAAWPDQAAIGEFPDVACAGTELAVTWQQKVGSAWHTFVNFAPRANPMFALNPVDLGTQGVNAGHPVAGGADGRAYVAWSTPAGTIRIHRWNFSSGFADLGERQIASGNPDGGGAGLPRITAHGSKLVVVWYDCGDIRARVSNDHGTTWGSIRTIFTGACGSEFGGIPFNAAMSGSRILVTYSWFQGFTQKWRMISSINDFSTRTDSLAYAASDMLLLGFVHPSGATRIAGAVDEGTRLRALRQP